jgi:hypothetical protein
MSNRHPVDELAELRSTIKTLEKRAEALRADIIAGRCSREGDEHLATIRQQQSTWVNQTALKHHFGEQTLAPFLVKRTVSVINLAARKDPAPRPQPRLQVVEP